MDFNCFPAFPTPIAEYRFEHHATFKARLIELLAQESFYSSNAAPGTSKNRGLKAGRFSETPAGDTQIHNIDEDIFKTFNDFLIGCARHFSHQLLGYQDREMFVTESWINRAERGGRQFEHYHVNCWLSGTYYLNHQEGNSPVIFKNPAHENNQKQAPALSLPIDNSIQSQYCHRTVVCNVSEGSLMVWPSHLTHFVPENEIDEPRISLSMNFMPRVMLDSGYGFEASFLRTRR